MVRRSVVIVALAVAVGIPVQAQVSAQVPATAFVGVSVVPMDSERVIANQTIVVQGDRITALGPADQVRVPANATRIDGRGKFLMPGLADMHAHLTRPGYMIASRLLLYLANGITTIREMMSDPAHVTIEHRIAGGTLLGPRMYTSGLVDADQPVGEIAGAITEYHTQGYDFLKFYGSANDPTAFDSVMAAAQRVKMPVIGHAYQVPGVQRAVQAHMASIEHLWGYVECVGFLPPAQWTPQCETTDSHAETVPILPPDYVLDTVRLRQLAADLHQAGVWTTPTLGVIVWLTANSKKSAAEYQPRLAWHQQIVKALSDAGAGLLLGTDIPNGLTSPMLAGFTIHQELDLLVGAGLSPYQALVAGTRNPALFFGTLDSTGTVAVGKRADLVLVDGNPLKDVRYLRVPAGTMVGGRWLSRATVEDSLQAMLRDDYPEVVDDADDGGPLIAFGINKGFTRDAWQQSLRTSLADVRRLPTAP